MKVLVFYRPNSEHSRRVEDFARDFNKDYINYRLELINVNTRDGAATASLYEIMRFPSLLALTNDGQVVHQWEGDTMPMMNEVSYYAQA